MADDEQEREREAARRLRQERIEELALERAEREAQISKKEDERSKKEDERRDREEELQRREELETTHQEALDEETRRKKEAGSMTALALRAYQYAGRSRTSILVTLMIIALILIGIPYILYKFGLLKYLWQSMAYIGLQILFIIIIYKGFKDPDPSSTWIAFAFLIWLIDMIPQMPQVPFLSGVSNFLGPPYAGFEFDFRAILNTNWVSVIFSPLFLLMIALGFLNAVRRGSLTIPIYFGLLFALNKFSNYFNLGIFNFVTLGFNVSSYYNYIALGIIVVSLILLFYFKDKLPTEDPLDLPSYIFMALVVSFFFVNKGWTTNFRALLHVAFILAFGYLYIRKNERNKPSSWHLWIPLFLIGDFYLYNFIWIFSGKVEGLQFVPLLVLFTIMYCSGRSETKYSNIAFLFIALIFLVAIIPTYAVDADTIPFTAKRGASFSDFATQLSNKIKDIVESRLDVATAGLYRGNVEKNRYESLGVYFANIRAADPRFYTNEPITVWGTIRSKTYKDAVIINFSCYRWKDGRKIRADRIVPNIIFPIFTLENVDTECTFVPSKQRGKEISSGTNTVTFSAEYNFGTDAYLKAYFIERDRFRAYARENIEPLNALGIKDKNPIPVHTNGPVEIGMKTGPLITVSEGYSIKPTIGISLLNRKEIFDKDKNIISKWDGKIKNITELVLLVPPGIEIRRGDGSPLGEKGCTDEDMDKGLCPCNMPFKEYKFDDCTSTCTLQVSNPCKEACTGSYTDANNQINLNAAAPCNKECDDTFDRCYIECNNLFQGDTELENSGEKYKAYALDVGSLKFKDLNKDIDKYRTFQCRYEPSKDVLGTGPISTRYFRVRTRYNYLLENSVTINVETPPDESKTTVLSALFELTSNIQPFGTFRELYFDGLTQEIINAIAYVESRARHCCQDTSNTRAGNCVESGEKDCPADRIITSGTSIGIMQVKYDTTKARAEVDKLFNQFCDVKSIYNYDCNVKVGVAILKNKYKWTEYGCKETTEFKLGNTKTYKTFIDGCKNGKTSSGVHYDSYTKVDAALRGYNGWGWDNRFDRDYVEKVKRAAQTLNGRDVIDPQTLASITRSGSGMSEPSQIESDEQQESLQPGIFQLSYNRDSNTVTILWTKPEGKNIEKYIVTRDSPSEPGKIICEKFSGATEYSCPDSPIAAGTTYTYTLKIYTTGKQVNEITQNIIPQ